jgi:hypothetical protein
MPQLDLLIFSPLLNVLLTLTALLLPMSSEVLLLAVLSYRSRRLLKGAGDDGTVPAAGPLVISAAARSSYLPHQWRQDLTDRIRALALWLGWL